MENPTALSKLRPGVSKSYTYSEPEDSSSDEMEDGKIKPKVKVTKRIRKKRGRKKRYHPIIDNIRQELIDAVSNRGEKIKEAAERLQINYSSAKSIFQVFKKEGRLNRKVLIRKPLGDNQDSTSTKLPIEENENQSSPSIQTNTPVSEVPEAKVKGLISPQGSIEKKAREFMLSQQQSGEYLQYAQNNYNSQFFPSSFGNQRLMDNTFTQNPMAKPINMPRYPMMNMPAGISPNLYLMQEMKNRGQMNGNPNLYYSGFPNYPQQQPQNWNWSKQSPNPFMAPYFNSVSGSVYSQNDHRTPSLFLLNGNNSFDASQVLLKEEFDGIKREHMNGFSTKIE